MFRKYADKEEYSRVTSHHFELITNLMENAREERKKVIALAIETEKLMVKVEFLEKTIAESPELRTAYNEFKKEEALRRFEEKWG